MKQIFLISALFAIASTMHAMPTDSISHDKEIAEMKGTLVQTSPDDNNEKVIQRYNRYWFYPVGYGSLGSYYYTMLFGVKKNSVMSNQDVEMRVYKKWITNPMVNDDELRVYFIEIINKSDKPIYIDREHCYKIDSQHGTTTYYDSKKAGKVERFLVIKPHKKANLSDYPYEIKKGGYLDYAEQPEDFSVIGHKIGVEPEYMRVGQRKEFSEEEALCTKEFVITYSKDKDFTTYSQLNANFYLRQIAAFYFPELDKRESIEYEEHRGLDEYTITSFCNMYLPSRRSGEIVVIEK